MFNIEKFCSEERNNARKKAKLRPNEFINQVLGGRRDFSTIELISYEWKEDNTCDTPPHKLSEHSRYKELLSYLKKQDLEKNPIVFDNSLITYLWAPGIYMPHVQARNVRFLGSNFGGADLRYGDFENTDFMEADISGARIEGANLCGGNFYALKAENVDFTRVKFLVSSRFEGHKGYPNVNFGGGNLRNADFSGLTFIYAALGDDLDGAKFIGTTLKDSGLGKCTKNTIFKNSKLHSVTVSREFFNLPPENFEGAELRDVSYLDVNPDSPNIYEIELRGPKGEILSTFDWKNTDPPLTEFETLEQAIYWNREFNVRD